MLPGYLPMPRAGRHDTLADYLAAVAPKTQKGFWANGDAYAVSLLKAWWGDAARDDNDWAYGYLPRLTGAHGTYQTVTGMLASRKKSTRSRKTGTRPARAGRPTAASSASAWRRSNGWWCGI